MKLKKQKPKKPIPNAENLPTEERKKHGKFVVRNNIAQLEEPLRIDKLLHNEVIDETQHMYGLQIITLWTIASRPYLKTMQYEKLGSGLHDANYIALSRMSAEDQFYKTMQFMNKRDRDLIYKVCIEEKAVIEAGRSLGIPVNSITVYLRAALERLGDALAHMRELKKENETAVEKELEPN